MNNCNCDCNCNRDIDVLKNELLKNKIESSDTISQFMEKCNSNFAKIAEYGGGPIGAQGTQGTQGVPTKPKVPIHVWKKGEGEGFQYSEEKLHPDGKFEITKYSEDLSDVKYQEGHLIILENAHVYILENKSGYLEPSFLIVLQSYDPGKIIDGANAYVHFAFANNIENFDGFITNDQLKADGGEAEPVSTYSLRRTYSNIIASEMPYMGIYSDNNQFSPSQPTAYTWVRVQGESGEKGDPGSQGEAGPKGDKGEKGDGYTGQQYVIDLVGDMSTISLNEYRTRLYNDDYCNCIIHAYYGKDSVEIGVNNVTINAPSGYIKNNDNTILDNNNNPVGKIKISKKVNDINIKFTPDQYFVFPQTPISFPIHIEHTIHDNIDDNVYTFDRDTIWTIKGTVSNFELEIVPSYRTIKLFEDGKYFPETLYASVYKTVGDQKSLFNLKDTSFTLLYKKNDNGWQVYDQTTGVSTNDTSCVEFKIVKNYGSTFIEGEELWDYEDVWVVADGKSSHYYHADLGNTESIMVSTTGVKKIIETNNGPQECAELKNELGYSITFNPKFYDGTNELTVTGINIGSNSGEIYYQNGEGSFMRELYGNTLSITRVPYGVDVIPMTFIVSAKDSDGIYKQDSVSFNIYISTITNTYTLEPTNSIYNTSTGKIGDTIGCIVYKNNNIVPTTDLDKNGLSLKYIVQSGGTSNKEPINYTEPLVYGDDDDAIEDEFTASDVSILFILYYNNTEVARSTVPLIKDGIDGRDGDSWQYIFCRSTSYPFNKTGISNPHNWTNDQNKSDVNKEYLGDSEADFIANSDKNWYSDHMGVNSEYRYEYQSYRKWDKNNNCWGAYGEPTLYSNYSEDGKNASAFIVMLSNPVAAIPVGDDDWSTNEKMDIQKDSTLVYLYSNTSDISSNNNISISLPKDNIYVKKGHFTTTTENGVNKVEFKPVVGSGNNESIFNFETNAPYKLPITLTYDLNEDVDGDNVIDKFVTTINWTLMPIKGLENFEVFVDKKVVNTSYGKSHELKVGYYSISSTGGKKFIESNEYGYEIILTNDITSINSTSIAEKNWQKAVYDFSKGNCYVVLVKFNEDESVSIIDYTIVTSINDGLSAIHLELTQDRIELPCLNGIVHPEYDDDTYPISSRMILYIGDKPVEDYNNITYDFKIDGESVDKDKINVTNTKTAFGEFKISKDLINGLTNIECIATYYGVSYHKILSIYLKESPFEISLNKNVLTRDLNIDQIIDEDLLARVKYWDINESKWIDTREGEIRISGTKGQENCLLDFINDSSFDRKVNIKNSPIATNNRDTEFRISYYINGKEITHEIIGIVTNGKNGVDGTAPSCESVEILGYSLNKDEEIDGGTWVSLDELDLQPGQPIYILNEYTWNDGTKTRVKSATLAGTQGGKGDDGKSRVLFYLGSFQDGTLTKSPIIGKLDDDRCDYFIDATGQAWMRTGSEKVAEGYAMMGVGVNTNNWKQSDIVGFLQANAIHANMINASTIAANSALVTTLFAQDVTAENLKVNAANIQGTLTASQIAVGAIPGGLDENDVTHIIGETIIDGGNIKTGTITASQIKAGTITSEQIKAGTITANEIASGVIPEDLDIDWLKTAFNDGSTIISNGLVLSSLIGVSGDNGIESGLNSSNTIKSGRNDYNDKKLVFFAGSNGLKTTAGGSTNVTSNSSKGYTSNSKIEFFSDGSGYVAGNRFKWDKDGKTTVQKLTIKNSILNGSVRSPFKHIDTAWNWDPLDKSDLEQADPDIQEIYDNLYCSVGMYALPWTWTKDNIGRHVTLIHNRGGNQVTNYNSNSISAPDGYYFFEDGVARKELEFSNEMFDLIGYGNEEGNFHGWIVNKRDNIMTAKKYGHNLKCLCFGTVSFTTDGTSKIDKLQTFDGTSTSTSYHISQKFSITSDTSAKSCTITMPECWFGGNAQNYLHVELTPVYNTRIPQIALGNITNNAFTVYTDKYPASFNFMLYNKGDWSSFSDKFAYDKIVYVENQSTVVSNYKTIYLGSEVDYTTKVSGFNTNASNGLTVVSLDGYQSWVNFSINDNGELTVTTKSTNINTNARYCDIRIKPKQLTKGEAEKDDISYIDITLYQHGASSGDDRWS